MKILRFLWQKHRLLLIGFSVASLVTLFFLTKFTLSLIYWSGHQDVPIETWMPVGYVARSYEVDRDWLMQQTGLPEGEYLPRLTIEDVSEKAGISAEAMRTRLEAAIQEHRGE